MPTLLFGVNDYLTPYLSARVSLSSVAESDDGLLARSQSLRMYTCLILALWWPAIISPIFISELASTKLLSTP